MQMIVNDQTKTVEIWLSREEKKDTETMMSLRTLYDLYRQKKYLVAVFLSGERDVFAGTRDLLLHNRIPKRNTHCR